MRFMKLTMVLIWLPCLAAVELISDTSKIRHNDEPGVFSVRALEADDVVTMRSAVGLLLQQKQVEADKQHLAAILRLSQAGSEFPRVAAMIAFSPQRRTWCESLAGVRGGTLLAAGAQAAAALMDVIGTDKDARLPSALTAELSRRQQYLQPLGIDVGLVREYLGAEDPQVQELALVAAAYAGEAGLADAVQAVDEVGGGVLGLKALYGVRTGGGADAQLLGKAFDRPRRQPRPISDASAQLMDAQLFLPAAAYACEAIGRSGSTDFLPQLHAALEHRDIRVRIEAARALGRVGDTSSVPLLLEEMEDCDDRDWPLLADLLWALGALPDVRAIESLIDRLENQEGRMRQDLLYALNSIRAEKNYLPDAEQWTAWWEKHREGFQVDAAATAAWRKQHSLMDMFVPSYGGFYGLQIISNRFCFVLDSSHSMSGTKIDDLKRETTFTIQDLRGPVALNLVDFGGMIEIYYPDTLVQERDGPITYVQELSLSLGTRSVDSMQVGMAIDAVDTIIFLSDGAPFHTQIRQWPEILKYLDFLGRYRPISISAVSFSAGAGNGAFMQALAGYNTGDAKVIE